MRKRSFEQQLREVPLFASLADEQLQRLSSLAVRVHEPAGAQLTREGERGNEFLVVLEGYIDVRQDGRVLATLGPGDFLGEIALIDERSRRTATAVATTAVVIAYLDRHNFSELMADSADFATAVFAAMAARVADLDEPAPD